MSLLLAVTQGPLQGRTLEFAPGSTVRIGRIVRGNNLAVKDLGVSSKHLEIKSENGKWILRDLESSNGTFLNGGTVDPNAGGVELRDGDCVKIGEATSISVAIGGKEAESVAMRRNPRRCAKLAAEDLEPVRRVVRPKKSEEKPAMQVSTRQRNRRLKNSDEAVLEVIPEDSEVEVGESKVLEVIPENSKVDVEETKVPVKPTRRARAQKGKDLQKNSVTTEKRESESGARVGEDGVEKNDAHGVSESFDGVEAAGGSVSKEVDLEKMTLGEWFDFLEVDLPKQIVEATEEIIDGMRLKARRVREYAMQQKKGKGIAL